MQNLQLFKALIFQRLQLQQFSTNRELDHGLLHFNCHCVIRNFNDTVLHALALLCLYRIDVLTALMTKINPYVKMTHKAVNSWGKLRYVYITLRLYYYFEFLYWCAYITCKFTWQGLSCSELQRQPLSTAQQLPHTSWKPVSSWLQKGHTASQSWAMRQLHLCDNGSEKG